MRAYIALFFAPALVSALAFDPPNLKPTFAKTAGQPQPTPMPKSVQVYFAHSKGFSAEQLVADPITLWNEENEENDKDKYSWHIFHGLKDGGVEPCFTRTINDPMTALFEPNPIPNDNKPFIFPQGEYPVRVDEQDCIYQGLGEERQPGLDVGWLKCPDYTVKCLKDPRFDQEIFDDPCKKTKDGIVVKYHPVAYCREDKPIEVRAAN